MEKLKIKNYDGLKLIGNYWESDSNSLIIMSHGFTGNKSEGGYFDFVARELNQSGYAVFAFDFSGSGESEGRIITTNREVRDLKSVINHFQKVENIGLFGHSLGGLVSLRNNSSQIDSMVLTSPVTDRKNNYKKKLDKSFEKERKNTLNTRIKDLEKNYS